MLWRFEFFVEGKHLERVMEAINGVALNFQPPRPVGNAVVKQGKIKAETPAISMKDLVLNDIKAMPPNTVFGTAEIKAIIRKHGGADTSYAHFVMVITEAKIATRRGRGQFVTAK